MRRKGRAAVNIIFLDVDGVLNSMPYCEKHKDNFRNGLISDFHLQMLSEIYHTCNARIVLSSTWRYLKDAKGDRARIMYQYLTDSLARYDMEIMSCTPTISGDRPLEIATWLKENADDAVKFVILDDDFPKEEYEKYGMGNNLIQTIYFCYKISQGGLQKEHVQQAIKLLKTGIR